MIKPKQKPTHRPVRTVDKARIPRTAMRAAWLRTREGTRRARRLTAGEQQDGQYQDAAAQEEHAADTAVSAAETAAGATLRGGKNLAQQVAQKRQTEKATGQAEQAAEQATGAATRPTTSMPVEPSNRSAGILPYYNKQNWQRPLCRLNRAIEAPEFYLIIISRIGKASLRGDNPHRLPRRWVWIVCAGGNPSISTRAACTMIRRHVFR